VLFQGNGGEEEEEEEEHEKSDLAGLNNSYANR
jgi:hypothetical protein